MSYRHYYQKEKPKKSFFVYQALMAFTACVSLAAQLSEQIWLFCAFPGENHRLWQFISYSWIHDFSSSHSSFSFSLLFSLLILWKLGALIEKKKGALFLLGTYLSTAIFAAFSALLFPLNTFLTGPGYALNALFLIWALLLPKEKLHFFPFLSLQTQSLVTLLFAFQGLFFLVQGSYAELSALLGSILWSFICFYSTSIRRKAIVVPFPKDERVDRILEKINAEGISSLSEKEKKILAQESGQ